VAGLAMAIQRNCDMVDARHARDSGMCIYLLGMREYFRWATGQPLGSTPDSSAVRAWIARQENLWDTIDSDGTGRLVDLPLPAGPVDPFDEDAVNRHLDPMGLLYGAGVGRFGVPIFLLAERASVERHAEARITVTDRELARGFVAAPAVSRGLHITIRRDALRRWLWTRAEEASRHGPGDAFGQALQAYRLADPGAQAPDGPPDAHALERMTHGELRTLVLHELGELRAGALLGPDWERMLDQLDDLRTEVILRAMRDILADCLVTLPELQAQGAAASLAFWFSNFDGMRRALAPELLDARGAGILNVDWDQLRTQAQEGRQLWLARAQEILARWRDAGMVAVVEAAQDLVRRPPPRPR